MESTELNEILRKHGVVLRDEILSSISNLIKDDNKFKEEQVELITQNAKIWVSAFSDGSQKNLERLILFYFQELISTGKCILTNFSGKNFIGNVLENVQIPIEDENFVFYSTFMTL